MCVIETSHRKATKCLETEKSALAQMDAEREPTLYIQVYYISYYLSMNGFDVWNKIIFMFLFKDNTRCARGNNNNILDASPVKWNAVCVVPARQQHTHRCRRPPPPPLREAINRKSRLLNAHCGSLRFFHSQKLTHAEWKQTRRFSHHASHFTTN